MEVTQESVTMEARERLTLRDAVRLSGMSEKTLRRKLEAGLLTGHRETLDYGGFMWMIDARSLADLYPDSAAVRDYVAFLEQSLPQENPSKLSTPPLDPAESVPSIIHDSPASLVEPEEEADERVSPARNDFVLYLLEENRSLKDDLRDRERQLRSLQDRALNLERECGEQRGTALTQARVLEWFQRQPLALAAPAAEGQPSTPPPVHPTVHPNPSSTLPGRQHWMAAVALITLLMSLLMVVKAF